MAYKFIDDFLSQPKAPSAQLKPVVKTQPKLTPKPNIFQTIGNTVQSGIKAVNKFIGEQPALRLPGIANPILPTPKVKVKEIVNKIVKPESTISQIGQGNIGNIGTAIKSDVGRANKPIKESLSVFQNMKKDGRNLADLTPDERKRMDQPIMDMVVGSITPIRSVAGKEAQIIKNETPLLLGSGDPEKRLMEALKSNKGLRAKQEALYTAERSVRINKAINAGKEAGGGEAGFYAKKGQLSGKFDTVQNENETLRKQLSQSDIDGLIKKIDDNNTLTEYEKIPATDSLLNLLQKGKIPTESELRKLNVVFKPETVQAIIDNRPLIQRMISKVADVASTPRSIMSSLDLSAPLRQGAVMAPSHPKEFLNSFKNMFGYAFSQKKFDNFYKELPKRPNYHKMRDAGLDITDMGGLNSREEAFQSSLAEKIPVLGSFIKGSSRAYTGFLNNFRADLFDSMVQNGVKMGKGNDSKYLKSLADFINTATGRGSLENIPVIGSQIAQSAPLLNVAFFSPRLIASRVSFFNPAMYAKMDPTVRKEAAKSIVAFVGSGLSLLGLAKLAGADVESDPTSADFGKIKVGDTRYDIWGGFQPYATFVSRMILNRQKSTTTGGTFKFGEGYKPTTRYDVALRFAEGKMSPTASFVVDALKGEDFEHNKFDLTNKDIMVNPLTKRMVPLIFNDLKDNVDEYGPFGPLVSAPGFFGVGQATYKSKTPKKKPIGTSLTPVFK